MSNKRQVKVLLRKPHRIQRAFQTSQAKRKVVRGGRRGGKTVGLATYSVDRFVNGRLRVLYTAPTADQLQTYWFEVKRALSEPIEAGLFVKNESDHSITLAGTKQRIRAKAQPLTSKIYTPNGTKYMGDIKVGDEVLTPFGTVTEVVGVYPQGEQDIYEITFGDGCKTRCTLDHLWEVNKFKDSVSGRACPAVVTTEQLLRHPKINHNRGGMNNRPNIPITEPVAFNGVPVPVAPYLLGVLIGDGTLSKNCSPRIATADAEILDKIEPLLPNGVTIQFAGKYDYRLAPKGRPRKYCNPLLTGLKTMGLIGKRSYEKFIPDCYKYNSVAVRTEILRGIMDADGSVWKDGRIIVSQTSEQLAADIAEIVQSLGGLCSTNKKCAGYKVGGVFKECRPVYSQAILYEQNDRLFSLKRKLDLLKTQTAKHAKINRSIRTIEKVGREQAQCIRVKDTRHLYLTDSFIVTHNTAWNADTLRGDYADVLVFDEYQLMDPDAWTEVGAPMLLDNDGEAVFIYTPPKPHDKAVGYRHAAALFKKAENDVYGEWAAFHFTSHDNPYISKDALSRIARDMTIEGYKREILAEDTDEVMGALWTRKLIEETRVLKAPESMDRIIVGVDPPGGATECGIVVAGSKDGHMYIFGDDSLHGTPETWANAVYKLTERSDADLIVGERNYGGDMVKSVLRPFLNKTKARYKDVNATRGKAIRAEPIVAAFERGEAHIVGSLPKLEDEMCTWVPGSSRAHSPNRLDAMVWACTELNKPARKRMSVAFG